MKFNEESTCWRYLIKKRWPLGVVCPGCHRLMRFRALRAIFQCPRCDRQISATSGTIFHKSRLSLKTWFQTMHWMLNSPDGISALQVQKQLHLRSYRSAWLLTHKIRTVMLPGEKVLPDQEAKGHSRFVARERFRPGTPHGWSSKYHRAYTAELAYRVRYGKNIQKAFDQLLQACITQAPVRLRDVTA